MYRKYLLCLVIFIGLPFLIAATSVVQSGRRVITHTIDQTGDTAEVNKYDQFTARDSFTYIDTIGSGSGSKVAVKWTSPLTVRRIAVAASVDTTYIDSLTIDLGTNATTIEYTVPQVAFTQASYIDTMVARINALAQTTDTIVAQDSGTYIKLVSKFAQDNLEGAARWTLAFGTDNNNMSESDSSFTTVKMVCDSMVAAINGTATLADSVTAAVDGDTVYTVTGDRPGWNIYCTAGDTAQDVVQITAPATSYSSVRDSVILPFNMYQSGWNALWGYVIVHASKTTTAGYGNADSCGIWLYARAGAERYLLDSTYTAALPDTNYFSFIANDTLFKEGFELKVYLTDSATDVSGARLHDVDWYFIPVGD